MKPRFFAALLAALMIFPLTGCKKSLLDKDDPVTLDVPEGQRHRVILVQQRFLAAGEGDDHQRRQQRGKKSWFHVLSLQIERAFDKLPYF